MLLAESEKQQQKELSAKGAKLVLAARREDRLKALQEDIKENGGEPDVIIRMMDVTLHNQMQELAQYAL